MEYSIMFMKRFIHELFFKTSSMRPDMSWYYLFLEKFLGAFPLVALLVKAGNPNLILISL